MSQIIPIPHKSASLNITDSIYMNIPEFQTKLEQFFRHGFIGVLCVFLGLLIGYCVYTFTHLPFCDDSSTAASTRWFFKPSSNVGWTDLPSTHAFTKSAATWMNVCS